MKAAIECKDCGVCQPNATAGFKSSNEWIFPSDYRCAWSFQFFPAWADHAPISMRNSNSCAIAENEAPRIESPTRKAVEATARYRVLKRR